MVFNLFCIYPKEAPSTIFLSKDCAEVTSFATTYACTGCCVCPATASANWLVSLAPTILKDGGCVAAVGFVGVATFGVEPPPPEIVGVFVDVIALTLAKPAAVAAPAAANPNAGPIIGIPAKDL
jgi:hypothetical protein